MRILPFMKPKKGVTLAGVDYDDSGGAIPIASSDTLGGVKIGNGITVSSDGTISSSGLQFERIVTENTYLSKDVVRNISLGAGRIYGCMVFVSYSTTGELYGESKDTFSCHIDNSNTLKIIPHDTFSDSTSNSINIVIYLDRRIQ